MANELYKKITIWLNQQGIENNLKSVRAAITKTTNEMAKLPSFSDEWYEKSKKLAKLKDIYSEMQKEIKATGDEIKNAAEATNSKLMAWGGAVAVIQGVSVAFRRLVSSTQEYVDAYATIDDAMSAVQKTTGMTREEVESLRSSLQNIDTRTSTEELLKIAEIGGRLGLAKEDIEAFTRSVDVANVALGDSFQGGAEEIATVLGKIRGAFQDTKEMGIEDAFNAIGSALNSVGATCAATEGNVAQFAQRLGALPDAMKPSVQEAIGLGAAFENSSINAEVAATAYGQLMTKAAANIGKFAAAMGEPVEEMRELLNTNPVEFMLRFAESMRGMPADELGAQLKELKLNAVGVQEAIGAMSSQTDEFRRILEVSATEFANGTSMMEEFGTVNNNVAAQLEKAKNAVQDAKAALGEELIPVITKLTQQSANGIKVMTEAVKWILDHKAIVIGLAAAYNRLAIKQMAVVTAKKISTAWTKAEMAGESAGTVVTSLFALAKAKLAKNTLAAANAQNALKAAFAATPWGAIITAVLTLAAAFSFFRSKTDEAAEAQQNLEEQITQQYNAEKQKVEDLQKIIENENSTRDQKLKAIKELKKLIPEYLADLDKEGKVVNNNKNAINDYLVALKNKIRYQSLEKALNDTENKIVEAELKDKKARDAYFAQGWGAEVWDKTKSFLFGGWSKEDVMNNADAELQGLYDLRAEYNKKMEDMDKELKDKTGKTYRELYNDNLLSSLDGNNPPGSGSGDSPDKELLTKRENFQKKLQQMETRAQADMLSGWEKTKQEIINKYEDLLTEAKELYGEDSEEFKKVQQLKLDAIAAAGQQYLEKNGKILEDFSQKIRDWQNEALPKGEDGLAEKLLGTEQKWRERTVYAQNVLNTLIALRGELADEPDVDLSSIDAEIERTETELLVNLPQMALADLQNTLRRQHSDIGKFIAQEQESITDSTLTETERQKKAIRERYDVEIRALEELQKEYLKKNMMDKAVEAAEDLERLKALMDAALDNVDKAAANSGPKSVWQQLAEFDWSNMKNNWQGALNLMTQGLQEFANAAFDIYGSIAQIQDNMMEAELQKTQEAYDAKSAALQRQLNDGVISQKAYDAKMQKLNEEKEKKEKKLKHEQFARNKTANIIQATIAGVLAAVESFKNGGGFPWGLIPMAMSAATTALQIAAIASQPNPYYKGGYIRGRQYAVMGEQGDEWVASNKLLKDRETAAVIAALDEYQRGNRKALAGITFAAPDPKIMSQAVSGNGRTFAPSNQVTNNYYPADNGELLKEMKQMNDFLRDPMNRRAYISRKIQLEFDEQEENIRSMARL